MDIRGNYQYLPYVNLLFYCVQFSLLPPLPLHFSSLHLRPLAVSSIIPLCFSIGLLAVVFCQSNRCLFVGNMFGCFQTFLIVFDVQQFCCYLFNRGSAYIRFPGTYYTFSIWRLTYFFSSGQFPGVVFKHCPLAFLWLSPSLTPTGCWILLFWHPSFSCPSLVSFSFSLYAALRVSSLAVFQIVDSLFS